MKQLLTLSRPRTDTAFIPELDGLRFIAIALVVLHHNHFVLRDVLPAFADHGLVWQLYCTLIEAGGLGVPLFFIVSGIVLGVPFARARLDGGPKVSLRNYFMRRIRRLEPPYLINLTLLFMLPVALSGPEIFLDRVPHYLASLVYLHNTLYNAWSEINFVAWSLEVEAQFYLLAPLLAAVFALRAPRFRRMVLILAMFAMSVSAFAAQDAPYRYSHSILMLGQYFLAGFLIADLLVRKQLYSARPSGLYDVLAIALLLLALAFEVGVPHPQAHDFGVIPLCLFFLAVFRGRLMLAALRWRPVFTIGGMCYTIYLYHFWIIQGPVRVFDMDQWHYAPLGVVAFDIGMMGFVFLVSAVFFILFERPFMNRKTQPVS